MSEFIFYFVRIIFRFPLSKKFLIGMAPLINKLIFKKLILQFLNH